MAHLRNATEAERFMDEKTIAIVGDWRHADFADALLWLNARAACACYHDVSAAAEELGSPARRRDPASILFMQSRPGQISAREVECLHAIAPLAGLAALVGPWCEGELRSGRPWPGVVRIPWKAWTYRLAQELRLAKFGSSSPSLSR